MVVDLLQLRTKVARNLSLFNNCSSHDAAAKLLIIEHILRSITGQTIVPGIGRTLKRYIKIHTGVAGR